MGVTQLARKSRVNKTRSRQRKQMLKLLTAQPVIKNVDIEAIKLEFASKKSASAALVETQKVSETTSASAE